MEFTLDEENDNREFTTAEENRQLAVQLAREARHEILIASYDFDGRIYSNSEFVDALSAFIREHRNSRVDILVWKNSPAVKQGHRLVDMAQRLTSRIRIHEPDKIDAEFIESYMVVDGKAYFRRPLADRYEGVASFHAPIIARDLKEAFYAMWERSTTSSEFRRLGI